MTGDLEDQFGAAERLRNEPTGKIILDRAAQMAQEIRKQHVEDVYKPALLTLTERIKRMAEYKDYQEALDNLAQLDDSLRAFGIVPEAVVGVVFNGPLVPAPMEFTQDKLAKKYFKRSRGEYAPARIMRALREMGCGSPSDIARHVRVKQKHLPNINPNTLKSALKAMISRGILERDQGMYRILNDNIK